jgi:hypothetical protein
VKKLLFALVEQRCMQRLLETFDGKEAGFYRGLGYGNSIAIARDSLLDSVDLCITLVTEGADNPYRVAIRFKKRDKCSIFYQI